MKSEWCGIYIFFNDFSGKSS